MARKRGSRSHDYDEKRTELARRLYRCIAYEGVVSFNAMAEVLGVSRPTLRHYFGDRDGAIRAALELGARLGARRFAHVVDIRATTAPQAIREALEYVVVAWRDYGLGRLHRVGLQVGLAEATTGRAYLQHALEPLLDAFEALLSRLQEEGLLAADREPRPTAIVVVSPLWMALLHQHALGGLEGHAIDLGALIDEVVSLVSGPRTRPRSAFDPFGP